MKCATIGVLQYLFWQQYQPYFITLLSKEKNEKILQNRHKRSPEITII